MILRKDRPCPLSPTDPILSGMFSRIGTVNADEFRGLPPGSVNFIGPRMMPDSQHIEAHFRSVSVPNHHPLSHFTFFDDWKA